jgi:hypothetical protein
MRQEIRNKFINVSVVFWELDEILKRVFIEFVVVNRMK